MGIGSSRGADRAIKAAELAVASPLLEASIDGAHGVLLSIQGGSNLGIFEINDAARLVQEAVHPEANIIFGAVIDDTLDRKSTRLNSSHANISYAVFCLKKKKNIQTYKLTRYNHHNQNA